jgi:DNA processing protein
MVLKILADSQLHIDEIKRASGMEINQVASLLAIMEIKGLVKNLGGMVYALAR